MRIALVGAEFEDNLAVRYLRAALEREGHQVEQLVFNAADETDAVAAQLAGSDAALAGFSMVFTARAREFADLATRARALGYKGHIVAGGHFAALNAEQLLADVPAFDSIGCGEGEQLLCDLARCLDHPESVRGMVYRAPGGAVVRTPAAEKPADLDTLAVPPRRKPFSRYLGLPIVNILGSRGCLHACSFCSIVAWHRTTGGLPLRLRSPECVADEMAALYRQGVRIFNFHDDNFFLPRASDTRARVQALRSALDARGVGRIAFAVKCRPDDADPELLAYLKSVGLFRLFLGIEAGTATALKRLGRGQTLEDNHRALAVVNELDLHACFNLLILNPDSTLEDFEANARFLAAHPRNPMNFCRTEVYAGTALERKLRLQHRLRGDYWGYDYEIADARAQQLFELLYPAFQARNYGMAGLHHVTMALDYEHQLLGHFFAKETALRQRVKDFIVAVNQNTSAHLIAAAARVREGFADEGARDAYGRALTAAVERDNARLGALGAELRQDVRRAARSARVAARGASHQVALAGIAATLALASGACRTGNAAEGPRSTPPAGEHGAPSPGTPATRREERDARDAGDADAAAPAGPGESHYTEMVAAPPAEQQKVAIEQEGGAAQTYPSEMIAPSPTPRPRPTPPPTRPPRRPHPPNVAPPHPPPHPPPAPRPRHPPSNTWHTEMAPDFKKGKP